jgi:hypothetical protein
MTKDGEEELFCVFLRLMCVANFIWTSDCYVVMLCWCPYYVVL